MNKPLPHAPPGGVRLQMQARLDLWAEAADEKALFLSCYAQMTDNMLAAIERRDFHDPEWVARLLDEFAQYYFRALDAYERDAASAPAVWRRAHDSAPSAELTALQKLLLGINAHINYDLVLTVADLLQPEWAALTEERRAARHADYCRVNDIIGETIDAIQETILAPRMPVVALLDRLMGPLDELLMGALITRWRDEVWAHATALLDCGDPDEAARIVLRVERGALETAARLCLAAR